MKTMKTIIWLLGMALMAGSCADYDWDENLDTRLSAFSLADTDRQITVTADNKDMVNRFEWEASHADNHTLMFYTMLFSTTEDFSAPFHTEETKTVGTENFIELTNNTLNIIAEEAGIAQQATGKIYWKVRASNGVDALLSANTGSLTLTRPAGYAYNPKELRLMGEATEAGLDTAKAVPMRMIATGDDTGVFEMFADLKGGKSLYLIERVGKSLRRFALSGGNLVMGDGTETAVPSDGVYRIRVDFNLATASFTRVDKVELWYDGTQDVLATMTRDQDAMAWSCTLDPFTAERGNYKYKFKVTETDTDGQQTVVWYGGNSPTMMTQTATTKADYFYLYPVTDGSDYCFRLSSSLHNRKTLTIQADFSATGAWYTHKVTVN